MMLCGGVALAQEKAEYRVTYDCDALFSAERKVYRWSLDIGQTQAVFYNESSREKEKVIDEISKNNDVTAVMAQLKSLGGRFKNANSLEVLVGAPEAGKYTYLNRINSDALYYEEQLPEISWTMTERDTTVCGYSCFGAEATVYGRKWTVWFAPEIPISYGPWVLGGLPGLILDAVDADGLFHFTAVGLEEAPEGAEVALSGKKDAMKCSRKRYLELRDKANGQSINDQLREMGIADMTVVKVVSADGKDIDMNAGRPKQNYLDLE